MVVVEPARQLEHPGRPVHRAVDQHDQRSRRSGPASCDQTRHATGRTMRITSAAAPLDPVGRAGDAPRPCRRGRRSRAATAFSTANHTMSSVESYSSISHRLDPPGQRERATVRGRATARAAGPRAGSAPSPAPCDRSGCSTGWPRRSTSSAACHAAWVIDSVMRSRSVGRAGAAGPARAVPPTAGSSPRARPARRSATSWPRRAPGRDRSPSRPTASRHRCRRTRRWRRRSPRRASAAGASIIDSSICVAVTTGVPTSTQWRMICFCRWGTSSSGQSMPRSPRATITASAASVIVGELAERRRASRSWRRSATGRRRPPRSSSMSAARRTNDRAM